MCICLHKSSVFLVKVFISSVKTIRLKTSKNNIVLKNTGRDSSCGCMS